MNPQSVEMNTIPLVVDLDGSLIATDCLWESLLILLKSNPFYLLFVPFWIFKGKQCLKERVTDFAQIDVSLLPYRQNVLDYIQTARNNHRQIILATATDKRIAIKISDYTGIFDKVIATTKEKNLSGKNKLEKIQDLIQNGEFDYIGNSSDDLPVWNVARRAIVVSSNNNFIKKVQTIQSNIEVLPITYKINIGTILKAIRVHQWIKNLLLFIPLLLAHKISDSELILKTFVGFFCFSLSASSVYIVNDLFDLESDRQHPRKKERAFAAGILPISFGIIFVPFLIVLSSLLSLTSVSLEFTFVLWAYLLITTVYSFKLKRIVIVDVLVLAGLYSLRIFAGSVVGSVYLSPWLIAFAIFLFLSLAFVKRYSELLLLLSAKTLKSSGRGYYSTDVELVKTVGISSGLISVLVFALYMNSREVSALYHHPQMLWLIGMCLLYWIIRIWLIASRGKMNDDPIIFTVKDKASYFIAFIMLSIIIVATL